MVDDKHHFGAVITDRDARLFVRRLSEVATRFEPVGRTFGKCFGEHTVKACQLRALVAESWRRTVEKLTQRGNRV